MGLVDLEHFEELYPLFFSNIRYGVVVRNCNLLTCKTLIHLFPLHIEEIITVMVDAGLQLTPEVRQSLDDVRDAQLNQRRSGEIKSISYEEEVALRAKNWD